MKRVAPRGLLMAAVLLLAGCWPFSPSDRNRDALEGAQRKWQDRGYTSYEFRVQRSCFCAPPATAPLLVRVQDGQAVSVTNADTGAPATPTIGMPLTVDALFAIVDDAIDREAATLTVTYDDALGYPLNIAIDYDQRIADEEAYYTASGLRPLR